MTTTAARLAYLTARAAVTAAGSALIVADRAARLARTPENRATATAAAATLDTARAARAAAGRRYTGLSG